MDKAETLLEISKYCGSEYWDDLNEAAAELRRLHAQRGALLEALKEILEVWEEDPAYGSAHADKARAAIAAVEGEKT